MMMMMMIITLKVNSIRFISLIFWGGNNNSNKIKGSFQLNQNLWINHSSFLICVHTLNVQSDIHKWLQRYSIRFWGISCGRVEVFPNSKYFFETSIPQHHRPATSSSPSAHIISSRRRILSHAAEAGMGNRMHEWSPHALPFQPIRIHIESPAT